MKFRTFLFLLISWLFVWVPAFAESSVTVSRGDVFDGEFKRLAVQAVIDGTTSQIPTMLGIRELLGNPQPQDVEDLQLGAIKVLRFTSNNAKLLHACDDLEQCGTALMLIGTQISANASNANLHIDSCSGHIGGFRVRIKCSLPE